MEDLSESLAAMRKIRSSAFELGTHVSDLRRFWRSDDGMFRSRDDVGGGPSVASSGTAIISLFETERWESFKAALRAEDIQVEQTDIKQKLLSLPWKSAGLKDPNTFTRVYALHALLLLGAEKNEMHSATEGEEPGVKPRVSESIDKVSEEIETSLIEQGWVGIPGYLGSGFLTYWALRAIADFRKPEPAKAFAKVNEWAIRELFRQLAFAHSNDTSQFDCTELAFAVALASWARRIKHGGGDGVSDAVLRHAFETIFQHQLQNGLWPKYRPVFHFPESGSNYCFTFEFLHALVRELPASYFRGDCIRALQRSVDWLRNNRVESQLPGWHSGGNPSQGNVESWATATVHSFLFHLERKMDEACHSLVLEKFNVSGRATKEAAKWDSVLDSQMDLGNGPVSLKQTIEKFVIAPIGENQKLGRRSVILFGPPGTAKTTIVRALAARIGWPVVEITPDKFLDEHLGFGALELGATRVFRDLVDLRKVVVFFDEMEEMVRDRTGESTELRGRFLTTLMLPKIMSLYDSKSILIFVATNHIRTFDAAIQRPGRFDAKFQVRPPTVEERTKNWARFRALKSMSGAALDSFHELVRGKAKEIALLLFDEYKRFTELVAEDLDKGTSIDQAFQTNFEFVYNRRTIKGDAERELVAESSVW